MTESKVNAKDIVFNDDIVLVHVVKLVLTAMVCVDTGSDRLDWHRE